MVYQTHPQTQVGWWVFPVSILQHHYPTSHRKLKTKKSSNKRRLLRPDLSNIKKKKNYIWGCLFKLKGSNVFLKFVFGKVSYFGNENECFSKQFQLNLQMIKYFLKYIKFNYAGGLWFRNLIICKQKWITSRREEGRSSWNKVMGCQGGKSNEQWS